MKKNFSLIKACLTDEMQLFRIKRKNQSSKSKIIAPLALILFLSGYVAMYSYIIIDALKESNQQHYLLSIFAFITFLLTFGEGIYKSGSLIFNCKDDDLLNSLPIKSSTVLFIRIFKFYLFEFLFNLIFLLPAIIVYAIFGNVSISYYFVSFFVLLLAPVIPILLSSLIGVITNALSSKFKKKNIVQIVFSLVIITILFLYSMKISYASDDSGFIEFLLSINKYAIKYCYTSSVFAGLIESFNLIKLLIYIGVNVLLFFVFVILMSKIYYKINSKLKENFVVNVKYSDYHIESNTAVKSLIKKELNSFINTPVLVVNSIFGMILYVVGVIFLCMKYNVVNNALLNNKLPLESIDILVPMIIYSLIIITSLMSSISSSMISLEGKKVNLLKSVPVGAHRIINSKVYAASLVLLPFLVIGDVIAFIYFKFNIFEILLCLGASVVFSLIAETLGIIVNLRHPKLDWTSEAEVVKQSASSAIAVLIGMLLGMFIVSLNGVIAVVIVILSGKRLAIDLGIFILLLISLGVYWLMSLVVKKRGEKWFNKLNI